ncbi:MAG: gliding motility-associated C-terminal domain-containing protein, partial [Bacteroidetes bacterium]|nr:gliding motility-associated C-terminal domain-containing protein [Bacteroidota bacterium]
TVQVNVNPAPQVNLGNDTTVCFTGHEIWSGSVPAGFSSVLWSTGSTVDTTFIDAIGNVSVTVGNQFNCIDSDTLFVGEFCEPTPLCFPDVITPNSDGTNDIFTPCLKDFIPIDNGNYKGVIDNIVWVNFVVYNRWGIKLFQSKDVIPKWDATFQGALVPSGTYYYIVRYNDSSKISYEQTGYITVLNAQ